jgi:hypothetical protein
LRERGMFSGNDGNRPATAEDEILEKVKTKA